MSLHNTSNYLYYLGEVKRFLYISTRQLTGAGLGDTVFHLTVIHNLPSAPTDLIHQTGATKHKLQTSELIIADTDNNISVFPPWEQRVCLYTAIICWLSNANR